jgi:hypothetical protein
MPRPVGQKRRADRGSGCFPCAADLVAVAYFLAAMAWSTVW